MGGIEIVESLDLGTSVAENDQNLEHYFIQTVALDDFLADRYDIIRGSKGSGKSAMLKVVAEHRDDYESLADAVLIVATEHTGEPSFKRAFDSLDVKEVNEADLVSAWKTYLLNLALDRLETLSSTAQSKEAIAFAESCEIRYRTSSPVKKIWWSLLRILHPRMFSIGMDKIAVEFPDLPPDFWTESGKIPDFPEALRLCVRAFEAAKRRCWLLIDRLDAAFQHDRALEEIALRSLLQGYKDFMGNVYLRPKIFLRTDLFEVVTSGAGFRELTHVADRTSPPILWDHDRLLQMIMERFAFNQPVCLQYGFDKETVQDPDVRRAAFFSIFPDQVDSGTRKPDTWTWMCARIRDGNNVMTPRDIHGLVLNAVHQQREILALGTESTAEELIASTALKRGLEQLSKDKLENTLVAENYDLKDSIYAFKKQKAEQNANTLQDLLGNGWEVVIANLVRIGFLERVGEAWKVPMIYRAGLEITQGAAFDKPSSSSDEDDDDA